MQKLAVKFALFYPFESGENELFVCGFAFVFVKSFAKFRIKYVHLSAQKRRRDCVLNVLFHARFRRGKFRRQRLVAFILQRQYVLSVERVTNEFCKQSVTFEVGLKSEFQKVFFGFEFVFFHKRILAFL